MTNNNPADDCYFERVRPGCACPQCGEDDIDALLWIDDENVRCDNCNHVYQPGQREDG